MLSDHDDSAIVFVHGLLGFESIRILQTRIYYFRALRKHLTDYTTPIYFPALPSVGTIHQRAQVLAGYLSSLPHRRLYLIAHSMGGLDCRYAIHHHDHEKRVCHLITVATPHSGTPLAVWFLHGRGVVQALGRRWTLPGLRDLTPSACAQFNQDIPNRPDVCYQSYAGHRTVKAMPLPFRPWTRMLDKQAGDNDSQVPVSSARWGEFLGTVPADHLELVGWHLAMANMRRHQRFDHTIFYRRMIDSLLDR